MENKFKIGEISSLFGIPASTLRYWDDMGVLVPQKNSQNQYREYTVSDLMIISDVAFYKSLGISLKQIQNLERIDLSSQKTLCSDRKSELYRQKSELELQLSKLDNHLKAIEIVEELKRNRFTIGEIDTSLILPFDLTEIDKIREYINDPYLYSRVQHCNDITTEQRGLSVKLDIISPKEKILWSEDKRNKKRYLICLLREKVQEDYPNDLEELLKEAQKTYKIGYIISRFLTTAKEGDIPYHYYKTFMEILD